MLKSANMEDDIVKVPRGEENYEPVAAAGTVTPVKASRRSSYLDDADATDGLLRLSASPFKSPSFRSPFPAPSPGPAGYSASPWRSGLMTPMSGPSGSMTPMSPFGGFMANMSPPGRQSSLFHQYDVEADMRSPQHCFSPGFKYCNSPATYIGRGGSHTSGAGFSTPDTRSKKGFIQGLDFGSPTYSEFGAGRSPDSDSEQKTPGRSPMMDRLGRGSGGLNFEHELGIMDYMSMRHATNGSDGVAFDTIFSSPGPGGSSYRNYDNGPGLLLQAASDVGDGDDEESEGYSHDSPAFRGFNEDSDSDEPRSPSPVRAALKTKRERKNTRANAARSLSAPPNTPGGAPEDAHPPTSRRRTNNSAAASISTPTKVTPHRLDIGASARRVPPRTTGRMGRGGSDASDEASAPKTEPRGQKRKGTSRASTTSHSQLRDRSEGPPHSLAFSPQAVARMKMDKPSRGGRKGPFSDAAVVKGNMRGETKTAGKAGYHPSPLRVSRDFSNASRLVDLPGESVRNLPPPVLDFTEPLGAHIKLEEPKEAPLGADPPPHGTPGKKNNPCTCKKSRCLKLYCDCFASSTHCGSDCHCHSCFNTPAREKDRQDAIRSTLERNPGAFDRKVVTGGDTDAAQHNQGCGCKKSACLKKYCECFQFGIHCGDKCKCTQCLNYEGSVDLQQRQAFLAASALPTPQPGEHKYAPPRPRVIPRRLQANMTIESPEPTLAPRPKPTVTTRLAAAAHPHEEPHQKPTIELAFVKTETYYEVATSTPPAAKGSQGEGTPRSPYSTVFSPSASHSTPSAKSFERAPASASKVPRPRPPAGGWPRKSVQEELVVHKDRLPIRAFGPETKMLPKKEIIRIFQNLDNEDLYNAMMVSKQWEGLALDGALWQY